MTVTTRSRDRARFSSATYLAGLMEELNRAAISQRIRGARETAGFRNRQDFADVLQVHWRTIEDWENPKHHNVPWDRIEEIAQVTGTSKMWLLHGPPKESAERTAQELAFARLDDIEGKVDRLAAAMERVAEDLAALRSGRGGGRSGQTA